MKILLFLPVILLLEACAAPGARCDRHLQPINTVPAAAGAAVTPPPSLP